ncbi:MAG: oligosaccharide flippase family protein [Calditrichia bacterium]
MRDDDLQTKRNQTRGGGGIKRLFSHSAIYSISTSVQRLQGLVLTPIYTSTVYIASMSDYSNYGLVYTFIAFMNFVYLYGMDSAFLRYFFLEEKEQKTVYSSTFWVLSISGLTTSVLLFLFSSQIADWVLFSSELGRMIKYAGAILFFDTIGNFPFLLLRAEEKPVRFTLFRLLRFTLELLLNILFVVVLKHGVWGILQANVIASVINLLFMLPFTLKYLQLKVDFSLTRQMVKFGLPFLPNGIAFMVIEMMDRFLVTKYLGKEVMAFYHANCKFASVLFLLIIGFRNAWQPFFLKEAKSGNPRKTYPRILSFYLAGAGMLVVLITFFVRDVLTYPILNGGYLLGRDYWDGITIIPWRVLAYFFYGIYVIFTPAFYILKKSQYMVLFTGLGAIVNLLINLFLLPHWGLWAAVTANAAAYGTMMLAIFLASQKIYPLPINWLRTGLQVLLVGCAMFLYYITGLSFGVKVIAFLVVGGAMYLITLGKFSRIGEGHVSK